jgi:hypothetical protein
MPLFIHILAVKCHLESNTVQIVHALFRVDCSLDNYAKMLNQYQRSDKRWSLYTVGSKDSTDTYTKGSEGAIVVRHRRQYISGTVPMAP